MEVLVTLLPLRRNREAQHVVLELDFGDRARAAELSHESAHERPVSRLLNLEPGGELASAACDREIPAADDGRLVGLGAGGSRNRHEENESDRRQRAMRV